LDSFILNFAYAEALELQPDFQAVHTLYANFLTALRDDLEKTEARIPVEAPADTSNTSDNQQNSNAFDTTIATQPANDEPNGNANSSPRKMNQELREKKSEYGLVYIMHMRFARRAEGNEGARAVFKKARVDKWVPWEVYEASGQSSFDALVEIFCSWFLSLFSAYGVPLHKRDWRCVSHLPAGSKDVRR
jgi:cleavage stimulation factor subunit 3